MSEVLTEGGGGLRDLRQPMQSPVNWALLGLIIERSSYAYELAQRFDRAYEGALSLSSTSHVYTALEALARRSFVEEVPGTRAGRQPKPRYRATVAGVAGYRDWLVGQLREERRRQRLFVLGLAALRGHPEVAMEIVDRYEQACLQECMVSPACDRDGASREGEAGLIPRLLCEENRLALQAKLAWVDYARRELEAVAHTAAPTGPTDPVTTLVAGARASSGG